MNNPFCSLCSSPLKTKLFVAPDENDNNKLYSFYQCTGCTLMQIRPFPNKKGIDNYYSYMNADDHAKIKNQQINFLHNLPFGKIILKKYIDLCYQQRYQLIMKLHSKGRILDIGCGEGSFLKKFSTTKWRKTGIEINKNLAKQAKKKLKTASILDQTLESAKLPKQSFEVITMWHVFEHLANPKNVLTRLSELIPPNGYIIIEVPNGNSIYRKLLKSNWQSLLLPQHLFFWTKASITYALSHTGFRVVQMYYASILSFSGSSSTANLLRSKGFPNYASIVIACIFFPISILLNLVLYTFRDNIIVIAELRKG